MWLLKIDTMISGKFVMTDYDINCLKIDIDVLCDAWLILALIYLLSRQLTPWHFFPGFEHFEVRAKTTCIAIEVLRLGPMNHEHFNCIFEVVHVANCCFMKLESIIVYVWYISGLCNEIVNLNLCIFILIKFYNLILMIFLVNYFFLKLGCCILVSEQALGPNWGFESWNDVWLG